MNKAESLQTVVSPTLNIVSLPQLPEVEKRAKYLLLKRLSPYFILELKTQGKSLPYFDLENKRFSLLF